MSSLRIMRSWMVLNCWNFISEKWMNAYLMYSIHQASKKGLPQKRCDITITASLGCNLTNSWIMIIMNDMKVGNSWNYKQFLYPLDLWRLGGWTIIIEDKQKLTVISKQVFGLLHALLCILYILYITTTTYITWWCWCWCWI